MTLLEGLSLVSGSATAVGSTEVGSFLGRTVVYYVSYLQIPALLLIGMAAGAILFKIYSESQKPVNIHPKTPEAKKQTPVKGKERDEFDEEVGSLSEDEDQLALLKENDDLEKKKILTQYVVLSFGKPNSKVVESLRDQQASFYWVEEQKELNKMARIFKEMQEQPNTDSPIKGFSSRFYRRSSVLNQERGTIYKTALKGPPPKLSWNANSLPDTDTNKEITDDEIVQSYLRRSKSASSLLSKPPLF